MGRAPHATDAHGDHMIRYCTAVRPGTVSVHRTQLYTLTVAARGGLQPYHSTMRWMDAGRVVASDEEKAPNRGRMI